MRLSEIATRIGAVLAGDGEIEITGLAPLGSASAEHLTFLNDRKYLRALLESKAGAAVIEKGLADSAFAAGKALLLADDPDTAFAQAVELFAPPPVSYPAGISEHAVVAPDATIAESAHVGPFCYVGSGAVIGERTVLVSGVYIGEHSSIGEDCLLYSGVVLREHCMLGNRVIVHPNAVIGSDGFGFKMGRDHHTKIPQRGNVVVGDDVEIGACACIDRARFASTVIGAGTKIDNLVQIAHNVRMGKHCLLAAQVGVAGTSEVGDHVIMAGQAGVADHITVGDGAILLARAGVGKNIPGGMMVSGLPANEHREQLRLQVYNRRVPGMEAKLKALEERVRELEAGTSDDKPKS